MSVVYALATPPAKSAICVFRVTGKGCHKSLNNFFGSRCFEPNVFNVGFFSGPDGVVDRVGLVVFKAPKSYTGEDSFEVYAHGGLAVMSSISKAFKGVGFEEAVGGEFTKRAFLNGKNFKATDSNQILDYKIGKRNISRIYEMCHILELKGEDYRISSSKL